MTVPTEVVRTLWERMEARDWDGAKATLHPDAVVSYVHTGERFVGRDTIIAMNAAYPEGWHIDVHQVWADGDDVSAWVRVPLGDTVSWCAQRATVADGLITTATELWVDERHAAPPAWRAPFTTGPTKEPS